MGSPRLSALLAVVLVEAGCGLPDAVYLAQPGPPGTISTPTNALPFQFTTTSRAADFNVQFSGYEVYYKCYAADDQKIVADSGYGSPNSTYSKDNLVAAGFQRLCLGTGNFSAQLPADSSPGSSSAPLINMSKIDPNDIPPANVPGVPGITITITMDDSSFPPVYAFSGSPPFSYYTYTPPSLGAPVYMEVRRYVADTPTGCKTFSSNLYASGNYTSTDADVGPIFSQISQGWLYVMMYALSYGASTIDATPQWSAPTYLGYTKIQILN